MTHVSTLTDAVDTAAKSSRTAIRSWVRNEALQQLNMNAILRSAGALDEYGDMKRVLTRPGRSNINQGVAIYACALCPACKENLVRDNDAIWNQATLPKGLIR